MRRKLIPKTRKSKEMLTYDMKREPWVDVIERSDKWCCLHVNSGIRLWIRPKGDPDWDLV